jgi:thiamine pyrophosphate-dependent acetolactate synthase large subunit-like protein
MSEIGKFLPPDAITCLDGHLCMLAAQVHIPCMEPLSRINVGSNGTLGVGVPFAMAAKLARPNQMVVAICGDSAFGFSAMELETAVRHKIPIIVIVVDNQGIWGGHIQKAHYPESHERVAMYGPDLHYEQIGSAFGAHAEHVISADEIRPALERAVHSNKPACIHVRIDPLSPLK